MCRVGSAVVMLVKVISFGIVLFLLWLRLVNILSFMVLWRWTSLIGLGASCYLCSRGEMVVLLGPRTLLTVLGNLLECALGLLDD